MTNRSRSTLFLIEQLIVIAVFAICAAACIRILTTAYFYATDSNDLSRAVLAAENGAEVFKAAGGDVSVVVQTLGGGVYTTDGRAYIYYDNNWQICSEADAHYVLSLYSMRLPDYHHYQLYVGELSVDKISGENLLAFPLAARREPLTFDNEQL